MVKREIYGLDFVISWMLVTIDETLRLAEIGWLGFDQSFNYNVSNRDKNAKGETNDKIIMVHPLGWPPRSDIHCRATSFAGGWFMEDGCIIVPHMPGLDTISFKFHGGNPAYITSKNDGDEISKKIRVVSRNRRPELVGKLGCDL